MTAIVLSLLMLLGLFPLTAYAANGPSEENMSYALFYNGEESYPVYREQQAVNDSIGGATYDRSTNTVTITDFNHIHILIHASKMSTVEKYKQKLRLTQKQIDKVNTLRRMIGLIDI